MRTTPYYSSCVDHEILAAAPEGDHVQTSPQSSPQSGVSNQQVTHIPLPLPLPYITPKHPPFLVDQSNVTPQYRIYNDMSSVTTTLLQPPLSTTQTCPDCGADLSHIHPAIAEDAQRRISELETQVRMLTGKATAAGTFVFAIHIIHSTRSNLTCPSSTFLQIHILSHFLINKH